MGRAGFGGSTPIGGGRGLPLIPKVFQGSGDDDSPATKNEQHNLHECSLTMGFLGEWWQFAGTQAWLDDTQSRESRKIHGVEQQVLTCSSFQAAIFVGASQQLSFTSP